MNGYKSYIGAAIVAISAGLNYLGMTELGDAFQTFGFAILGAGVAHKVAKINK